jgi:hypothetical protein
MVIFFLANAINEDVTDYVFEQFPQKSVAAEVWTCLVL